MNDFNLAQAVVGSRLRVPRDYLSGFDIVQVTALTKTSLVCGQIRIRKSDGLITGSGYGWHRRFARLASEADIMTNRIEVAQSKIREVKVNVDNLKMVEELIANNN